MSPEDEQAAQELRTQIAVRGFTPKKTTNDESGKVFVEAVGLRNDNYFKVALDNGNELLAWKSLYCQVTAGKKR